MSEPDVRRICELAHHDTHDGVDGAEYLDQPTDLPDGYHKSSAPDPEGV